MLLRLKKNILKYSLTAIGIVIILYSLFLSSSSVRYGDIGFNTDMARDFLLLQDIRDTHKLTLLGPRSGGIPGVFHGPLWIYLNLPVYLLSHGNPVAVGWFWIGLIALLIGITYFVGRKIWNHTVGMIAALLVALNSVSTASTLFNPFGAVIVSPLFFFFFYRYFVNNKVSYLLLSLFTLGILIQFQIAFGGPMLFLATILILYKIYKHRKWKHLLSYFILLIPFSTYILFDIRHQFLQLNAIIAYAKGGTGAVKDFTVMDWFLNRVTGFLQSLAPVVHPTEYFVFGLLGFVLCRSLLKRQKESLLPLLFFYFFVGYWLITFLFKGVIWSYYYWPFMPIVMLFIASCIKMVNKYIAGIIILFVCLGLMQTAQSYARSITTASVGKDSGSWLFNYHLAQDVFTSGDKTFGYYIFSPDQYGYSVRYAMNYVQKEHPSVVAHPFQKDPVTYLIIAPPGGKANSIGGDWWKVNRVHITKKPQKKDLYANGFRVERYILSEKERAIPSDPNLIDSLIFR